MTVRRVDFIAMMSDIDLRQEAGYMNISLTKCEVFLNLANTCGMMKILLANNFSFLGKFVLYFKQ